LPVAGYEFKIIKNKNMYVIEPSELFKDIVSDIRKKETKENMAFRFHFTAAEMIKKICLILRKESKTNKVVLSGGVFQNKLLLTLSLGLLYKEGFRVFTHQTLSSNDSGISLGQAVIANFRS
jgi:hydrogenase maturation protein HypF